MGLCVHELLLVSTTAYPCCVAANFKQQPTRTPTFAFSDEKIEFIISGLYYISSPAAEQLPTNQQTAWSKQFNLAMLVLMG